MLLALTFDDGPNTTTTPQILDILKEYNAVASFFLIGRNITPASGMVVHRALSQGCEICNHSISHLRMGQMTPEEIYREVQPCSDLIQGLTGYAPRFFRPPFIDVSPVLFDNVDLTFICGSGCNDWMPEVTAQQRIQMVLSHARDGEIILLHDSEGNINTVKALRFLVPELRRRGFRFVTCSQLFRENRISPAPGHLYSNVFE
ncbi:MAG: polysaccharide deacetylase family protein [Clostridia bacterium]|nr:polysaccharide deacetylase family protein [Clostridia bacterium]